MTAEAPTQVPGRMGERLRALFPELVSAVTVALAARFILEHYGIPVMLMALLLGVAFTFLAEPQITTAQGVE